MQLKSAQPLGHQGKLVIAGIAVLGLGALVGCSSSATQDAASNPATNTSSTATAPKSASASAKAAARKAAAAASTTAAAPSTTSAITRTPSASSNPSRATPKQTARPAPTKKPTVSPHLTVSKTTGLNDNQLVTVRGTGFDTNKGIYVAFCVKPAPGSPPSPCGGGADTDGNSGSSRWISSNPPPYGKNLVIPYSAGGSFTVTIRVSHLIGNIDCRTTKCVIASRADHTRTSDRSADVLIPITFKN